MKKNKIILCIASFVSLLIGTLSMGVQSFSVHASTIEEDIPFYQQVANLGEITDFGLINIEKDSTETLESSIQSIQTSDAMGTMVYTTPTSIYTSPLEEGSGLLTKSCTTLDQLTSRDVQELMYNTDYMIEEETENEYIVRNIYSTKRLIVFEQLENTYNATGVAKDDNMTILQYDTIEDTKKAHQQLLADGIGVDVDSMITTESYTYDYDYSGYKNWGAKAMNVAPYLDYLNSGYSYTGEVIVAVLDTGIYTHHEMFQNRIRLDLGYSFYSTTYTYSGYSFEDDDGHGTHVSGIIAGLTPSNVKILPIRVLGSDGKGSHSNILAGLSMVADYIDDGYHIVCANMSLGANSTTKFSQSTIDYYDNLYAGYKNNQNFNVVKSAGNKACDTAYNQSAFSQEAFVVSALQRTTNNASGYTFASGYSNFGSTIDVCAPGSMVGSAAIPSTNTIDTDNYVYMSGTSMAAPQASAAMALVALDSKYYTSSKPNYFVEDIEEVITSTATDYGVTGYGDSGYGSSGWDQYYGYGVINFSNIYSHLSYNVTDTTAQYDGTFHNISVSVTDTSSYNIIYGLSKDEINITNIATNNTFKNCTGNPILVYFRLSAKGYLPTYGYGYLNITANESVTVTIQAQSFTYGQPITLNQTLLSVSGDYPDDFDTSSISLYTTAKQYDPVGTYEIHAKCSDANYQIQYTTGTLSITKRPLTISLYTQSFVYGDAIKLKTNQYSIVSGNIVNNDYVTWTLSTAVKQYDPVGTYTYSIASCNNANYQLSTSMGTLKITSRPITINLANQVFLYNEDIVLDNEKYIIGIGTLMNDDQLGIVLSTTAQKGDDVGHYVISLANYTNTNYDITSTPGILTITQSKVVIEASTQVFTYGENIVLDQTAYTIVDGTFDETQVVFSLSTEATSTSSVGHYLITITSNSNNFTIDYSGYITIVPREITIQLSNQSSEFGKTVSLDHTKYTITQGSIVNSDQLGVVLTTNAHQNSDVGDYTISLLEYTNNNYSVTALDGKLTITQMAITITLDNQSGCYGDTIIINQYAFNVSDTSIILSPEQLVLSTTATSASPIGEYPITATCSNTNFVATIVNAVYTIYPRPITYFLQEQMVYYGEDVVLDQNGYYLTAGSFVNDDSATFRIVTDAQKGDPVGYYPIYLEDWSNPNYTPIYTQSSLTIMEQVVQIRVHNKTSVYGEPFTIDQTAYTINYGTILEEDLDDFSLYTTATSTSPVASDYTIDMDCNNPNYLVVYTSGVFSITKRSLTIALNTQSSQYGDSISLDNTQYTITQGSIVGEDQLGLTLTTNAVVGNVIGQYTLKMTSYSNENYTLTCTDGIFCIIPRQLTLTINDQTFVYGEAIEINQYSYVVTSGSIYGSYDQFVLYQKEASTNAGTYVLSARCVNDNYDLTSIDATLTITPRPIAIQLQTQTIRYGDALDFDTTQYVVTSGSIIGQEDLGLILQSTAVVGDPIGDYTLSLQSYTNHNYTITATNSTLTISPRLVEITISDHSVVYGDAIEYNNIEYTLTQGSIVNNDTLGIEIYSTITNNSKVGTYSIKAKLTNTNYQLSYVSGTLTITPRPITIQLTDQSFVFGDTVVLDDYAYTVTEGNLVGTDTLSPLLLTNASTGDNVGTYIITMEKNYNTNYEVTATDGILTITARPIKLSLLHQYAIYGNDIVLNHGAYRIDEGTAIASSPIQLTLTTDAIVGDNIGDYALTLASNNNTNYDLTVVDSILTITQRTVHLIAHPYTMTYGDTPNLDQQGYTVSYGSIPSVDQSAFVVYTNATSTNQVGHNYTVEIKCISNNYIFTYTSAKLTIVARPIRIAIGRLSFTYGDTITLDSCTYSITNGNIVGSDSLGLSYQCQATTGDGVGDYPITLTGYTNTNYDLTYTSGTLTITKRYVTLQLQDVSSVYGNSIVLNQGAYTVTEGSIYAGDEEDFTIYTNATRTSNVGTYNIYVGCSNPNYTLSSTGATLTISARTITINLTRQYFVYGNPLNLNINAYTVTSGNIVGNDSLGLQLTTDAQNAANVGTYGIQFLGYSNNNYIVQATSGTLVVQPKPIRILIDTQSSIYGNQIVFDEEDYHLMSSLAGEDTLQDLGIVLSTTANVTSPVGTYVISARCTNNNYSLSYTKGSYKVEPRPITIQLLDQTFQSQDEILYDHNAYRIVSGNLIGNDQLGITIGSNANSSKFGDGTYELSATYTNTNYDVTIVGGTLTIQSSNSPILLLIVIPSSIVVVGGATVGTIFLIRKRKKRRL